MKILIDGYNLLHAIGFRGDLRQPGQLERARLEMLDKLAVYLKPSELRQLTVIFDQGRRSRKKPERFRRHGILVEFAIDFDDADSMIETILNSHASPQKLLVVSSDHRIQNAARRRKARFVDSDVWIDQLEHPTKSRRSPSERESKPSMREDAEYWLKLFQEDFEDSQDEDAPREIGDREQRSELADSNDDQNEKCEEFFNPFPEGYGEDLIDPESLS